MPTVQVRDMAFQAREKDLVLGTFGRGAWVFDDIESLRALASSQSFEEPLFFEPPTAYQWERKQSPGVRFAASATFRGENRRFGARMTAYLPEVEKDNKKKMRVDYQNALGDTIYTQYIKVSQGLNNWRWSMSEKGTRYPQFKIRKDKEQQNDARGAQVLPGIYLATMNWNGTTATQKVTVKQDFRMETWVTAKDLESRKNAYHDIEAIQAVLDSAVQELAQADNNIERLQELLKNNVFKADSTLHDTVKVTAKALEKVRLGIFGEKEVKGYFEQPETWSSTWGSSLWQLLGSQRTWGSNELALYDQLEQRTKEAIDSVNEFLEKDYHALLNYLKENPVDVMVPLGN